MAHKPGSEAHSPLVSESLIIKTNAIRIYSPSALFLYGRGLDPRLTTAQLRLRCDAHFRVIRPISQRSDGRSSPPTGPYGTWLFHFMVYTSDWRAQRIPLKRRRRVV